jgi:Asp-tRNA(Asn)/Glu-tRNA(Gln) amidotransferase A subunit family amidase
MDLVLQDATSQAEAIRRGDVSAVELLKAYLKRIDAFNEMFRALVAVDEARALRDAERVDRLRRDDAASLPPLAGIPMSIKDTDDVAGLPTTQSCGVLADHVAVEDCPIVSRVRAAGALPFAKSNIPEFCSTMTSSRLNGVCRNPFDTARTAGGSSGGAAAALAAGLCAISHGTDAAGSVRAPASFCGLVGVKPTRGLVTFGPELDPPCYDANVHGILARSTRDAAAMLDAYAPRGGWTPARAGSFRDALAVVPKTLRIAICTDFPVGVIEPEVTAAVERAALSLEALGHVVSAATPDWATMLTASMLAAPSISKYVALEQAGELEPRNQAFLQYESKITILDQHKLVERARAASRVFLSFWDRFDVLVTPTAGIVPPSVDWAPWDQAPQAHLQTFSTFANFAQPFNITGQPAMTLPLGWSSQGLPIGVQFVARHLEEATLFSLAAQIEQADPWAPRTIAAARALTL